MLEMGIFDDGDLDILMPGLLLLFHWNEFSTNTILQRHSIQGFAPLTMIAIDLERNKSGAAFFPLYQNEYV